MAHPEPEITQIASILAERMPTQGVAAEDATQAWRHALRYARATGAIDQVADGIAKDAAGDLALKNIAAEIRR